MFSLIFDRIKPYFYGVLILLVLGAIWRYEWLLSKVDKQAAIITDNQKTIAQDKADLDQQLSTIAIERAARNDAQKALIDYEKSLEVSKNETEKFRTCIANGACVMHIRAACSSVSAATGTAANPGPIAGDAAITDAGTQGFILKIIDHAGWYENHYALCIKTLFDERKKARGD